MICFKFRTLYLHYSSDFETCQYFLCNFPNFFRGDFMYENYCKIRDLRKLKDSDVSKGANVSKSTFSDWKSGRSLPGTDKVLRIAKFLEVTVEELLGSENYEYDSKAHTWDYALNISKKDQAIIEKVNEKYGTNITVELNSSWKSNADAIDTDIKDVKDDGIQDIK